MTIFIMHGGELVEAVRAPPRKRIHIITDGMPSALHPVTGKMMDSKAAFRAATRAAGYEEVGNEIAAHMAPPVQERPDVAGDVSRAIEMLEQGYVPPPVEMAEADIRML